MNANKAWILVVAMASSGAWAAAAAGAVLTHGPIVADVQPDAVQVWVRTSEAAAVQVAAGALVSPIVVTEPASDFTASLRLTGLAPSTSYDYSVWVDDVPVAWRRLHTAPPRGTLPEEGIRLAVIADAWTGTTSHSFASAVALDLDGFVLLGDYDHRNPGTNVSTSAGVLAKIRNMHKDLRSPTGSPLGRSFAAALTEQTDSGHLLMRKLDDHDALWDNVNGKARWWPEAKQAFVEYHPLAADNGLPLGMWESTVYGGVALIGLDLRSQRTVPGQSTCQVCTILGAQQKAWLSERLAAYAADPDISWIVLLSTVPVNPRQAKSDTWSGYALDRQWLFNQVVSSGAAPKLVVVSADCHFGSIVLPPLSPLPELNSPMLGEPGTSIGNTCSNNDNQWTLNQPSARPGFGLVTVTPAGLTLEVRGIDGTVATAKSGAPMRVVLTQ